MIIALTALTGSVLRLLPMKLIALFLTLTASLSVNGRALMADPAAPIVPAEQPAAAEKNAAPLNPPVSMDHERTPVEANPYELDLKIALEDDAKVPVTVTLFDRYHRADKTWDRVAPGELRLELPKREPGNCLLEVSAHGYALDRSLLTFSNDGVEARSKSLKLYRRRFAVLQYVVNLQGARTLTGDYVKKGRVAICIGNVPDLYGDWRIKQNLTDLEFDYHRFGANGFATPPEGVSFDEITDLPQPDQYKPGSVLATKGQILLCRIEGNGPRDRRYAKILVEDVTETPPNDVQIIDKVLPQTRVKVPPLTRNEAPDEAKSSGEFTATVHLEDGAQTPVTLELQNSMREPVKVWKGHQPGEIQLRLPELDHDRYKLIVKAKGYAPVTLPIAISGQGVRPAEKHFELYRERYLVLQYAINAKGNRNLIGADVETGRVAVLYGKLPGLIDWSVAQEDGKMKADLFRFTNHAGFAAPPEGISFDQLETAPPPEEYKSKEFDFEIGMLICNRVVGHEPKTARYAKILVEDITETPPERSADH